MIDIDTAAGRMVAEHARGDSYRAIGEAHGLSHEGARQVVIREGTRFINALEMDLYLARKLERMGREATWPTLLVPFQDQDDWQTSLSMLQWSVDRLRARDVDVHVQTRPTSAGTAFQLTLGVAP